jgi:tetratricopeptide (TPR) repeat protein
MKKMNAVLVLCLLITAVHAENKFRFSYKINSIDDIIDNSSGEEKFEALMNTAGYYMTKFGDAHKGIAILLQARDLALEIGYTDGIVKSYESLGGIYLVSQNYSIALDYYSKQAELLKTLNREKDYASVLIKMADVSLNSKNFDRAIHFADEALIFALKAGDDDTLTRAYYFLGLAYRGKFEYAKALEFTKMSLEISERTDNTWFAGNCYNAIGDINEMMGNYGTALENYQRARTIYEEFNLTPGLSIVYFNLASMYKVNGDHKKALEYLNKSLDLSLESKNDFMIKENYMGLYGMYNLLKDFKKANEFYMLYNSFASAADSSAIPVSKIEIDYEIAKKDMENELLSLKLGQEKNIRYVYAGVFALILGVTYFLFYRKLKQKKINELKLEERRVRAELSSLESKINPHFLFNSISSISELISFDPASAKKMLQNISGLLRYTLRTSKNEFVHLDEEIMMIRKYLEIEKIRFGKRLEFSIEIPENLSNMLIPPLLIQPLVENSIKHGLSNRLEGGIVKISAYEKIPGRVTIEVEDNGISKEGDGKPEGNGIGLSSVKERLALVYRSEHSFKVEKDNGFKVIITIPKKS